MYLAIAERLEVGRVALELKVVLVEARHQLLERRALVRLVPDEFCQSPLTHTHQDTQDRTHK